LIAKNFLSGAGAGVEGSIGVWAFNRYTNLTAVIFLGDAPKLGLNAFGEATPPMIHGQLFGDCEA
tara:strand:+ start:389 stop:583 length:195 start_codon:yes stop_codon:yes gene_type:complete